MGDTLRDIHFVYLGETLPLYAKSSLELARRQSGCRINLIGNRHLRKSIRNTEINFIEIEDFYEREPFLECENKILSPKDFRNGFWTKSLERLFVLEQFSSIATIESIFHAELDQLLFRVDTLIDKLHSLDSKSLFYPIHNSNKAVASVIFSNDTNSLSKLINFTQTTEIFQNEMELLSRWTQQRDSNFVGLPTLLDKFENPVNSGGRTLAPEMIGGVVDAAQLGQWIAGIDPKNVPIKERPSTKFVDAPDGEILSKEQLSRLRFKIGDEGYLSCEADDMFELNLYNLHLHSKVHPWIIKDTNRLNGLLASSNEKRFIPGTARIQKIEYMKVRFYYARKNKSLYLDRILMKCNKYFGRRSSSYPYISGDTFRSFADHIWEEERKKINIAEVKENDVIFCQSENLKSLVSEILIGLQVKVILLLGNSDSNHGKNLDFLAKINSVKYTFAQNLLVKVPNISPLPIGLENLWRRNNGKTVLFKGAGINLGRKTYRVMWTFTIKTNKEARLLAARQLSKSSIADNVGILKPKDHAEMLRRYAFVACPPGNGADTHRIWEAMYLRCIPIVLRNHMNEYFEELGLPIWVVESYSEIEKLSEAVLSDKYNELSRRFDSKWLWARTWLEEINSKKQ
jgi:hypothetical protein